MDYADGSVTNRRSTQIIYKVIQEMDEPTNDMSEEKC
jgi:hypothetical protein